MISSCSDSIAVIATRMPSLKLSDAISASSALPPFGKSIPRNWQRKWRNRCAGELLGANWLDSGQRYTAQRAAGDKRCGHINISESTGRNAWEVALA